MTVFTAARHSVLALLALHLLSPTAPALDIVVPTDYATIQAAIDAASSGDTITVLPGIYPGNIDYSGKDIVIRSAAGPEQTTIEGLGGGAVVRITSGESLAAVLEGFTITGGTTSGIFISSGSTPSILSNWITENRAESGAGIKCFGGGGHFIGNELWSNYCWWGGAFKASGAEILFKDNIVRDHTASAAGGSSIPWYAPLRLDSCTGLIEGNHIHDNHSLHGSAIKCDSSDLTIRDNLIERNRSDIGSLSSAAIIFSGVAAKATIEGNIIRDNDHGADGTAIYLQNETIAQVLHNEIRDNAGRGIYIRSRAHALIEGNLIVGQRSAQGAGIYIAFQLPSEYVDLRYNTIAGNDALEGSAIYMRKFDIYLRMQGNILSAPPGVSLIQAQDEPGTTFDFFVNHNDFHGSATELFVRFPDFIGSNGNISAAPLFADPAAGDWRLQSQSPCIDSGNSAELDNGVDLAGFPRLIDGDLDGQMRQDMGALEFNNTQLALVGDPIGGSTLELRLDGLGGHTGFILAGSPSTGQLRAPFGSVFIDLTSLSMPGFGLIASGPLPLQVQYTLPLGSYDLALQGLMRDPSSAGGNLSNPLFLQIE